MNKNIYKNIKIFNMNKNTMFKLGGPPIGICVFFLHLRIGKGRG
jgi:hypothetical protein